MSRAQQSVVPGSVWTTLSALTRSCLLILAMLSLRLYAKCPCKIPPYQNLSGGTISGVVLDPDGRHPVARARVYAFYEGPQAGLVPETRTDDEGRYWLEQVAAARPCWVVADKVEDGYPDPVNAMYGYEWRTLPKVTVEAGKVINDVTVLLFPKVGKLVIRVFDAATELQLKGGYWDVSRSDDRELSMGGSSSLS